MKYRTLPGTGISVSNLALGTMGFGTETDEAAAFAILDRFVEADGNLVDTANVYGGGASEELLGRWFANRPAEVTGRVVLATKAHFTGWQLQLTMSAEALGFEYPVTLQPQYSLVSARSIRDRYEIVPAAGHNNIGLLPWSPLAGGFLSGSTEEARGRNRDPGSAGNLMVTTSSATSPRRTRTGRRSTPSATSRPATASPPARSPTARSPAVRASSPQFIGARTLDQREQNLVAARPRPDR